MLACVPAGQETSQDHDALGVDEDRELRLALDVDDAGLAGEGTRAVMRRRAAEGVIAEGEDGDAVDLSDV